MDRVRTPRGVKNSTKDNEPSRLQSVKLTRPEVTIAIYLLIIIIAFRRKLVDFHVGGERASGSGNLVRNQTEITLILGFQHRELPYYSSGSQAGGLALVP